MVEGRDRLEYAECIWQTDFFGVVRVTVDLQTRLYGSSAGRQGGQVGPAANYAGAARQVWQDWPDQVHAPS